MEEFIFGSWQPVWAVIFTAGSYVIAFILIPFVLLSRRESGATLAWIAFDGFRAATLNWSSFSQVAFAFDVNAGLLVQGIGFAMIIGLIGGLFPAVRAARLPVSEALREQ